MKQLFRNKKPKYILAITLTVLLVGLFIWWLWPPTTHRLGMSVVVVRDAFHYELRADGKCVETFGADTVYHPGVWINRKMLFPSCGGTVAAALSENHDTLTTLKSKALTGWLSARLESLQTRLKGMRHAAAELRYYMRTHGPQDEGYQEMALLNNLIRLRIDSISQHTTQLRKAEKSSRLKIVRLHNYTVTYKALGKLHDAPAQWENRGSDDGYMRLRISSHHKPLGVIAVSLWPWLKSVPQRIYVSHYEQVGFLACKLPHITSHLTITSEAKDRTLPHNHTGYWAVYEGDSVVYAGYWKKGKREGQGEIRDSLGRPIKGIFAADTLYYGIRRDSAGTYQGAMDRLGHANGHGRYFSDTHIFYEGHWTDDQRHGFGFSVGPKSYLRIGEWKHDVYKGERLVYNSERIYGIDISRFQHEVKKKVYSIDWNSLRITHLGTISKKRVRGKVNYPVSFMYIKATEGMTVRNKYYPKDYRDARQHGLRVGTYHFFSTTSAATQQANYFIQNARFSKGDLPPVLDLEPFPSQIRKMGGPDVLFSRVRTWLQKVEQHVGVKPILYVNQLFVNNYLSYAPDLKRDYQIWIARYGEYKPDVRLLYWQLSPDGRVSGIKGEVDINVFNGYSSEFQTFLSKSLVKKDIKTPAPPKKTKKAKKKKRKRRR